MTTTTTVPTTALAPRGGLAPRWPLALGAGVALGAVTEVAQGVLPEPWAWAANSVSAWVGLTAFTVAVLCGHGGRSTRWAITAALGLAAMEGLVAGYYLWANLVSGTSHAASSIAFWAAAALVGGPVVGLCTWWWRHAAGWLQALGAAVISASFAADGLRQLTMMSGGGGAWIELAVAVALPLLLLPGLTRLRGLALLAAIAAAGVGALALLDQLI